jgi:hypothetical protein
MPVPVFCPTCQKTYAVRDELRGRSVRCPAGHLLTVPSTADPPSVEPDEPPAAPRSGTLVWALLGGGVLTLVLLAGATVAVLVYLQNRSAPEPAPAPGAGREARAAA